MDDDNNPKEPSLRIPPKKMGGLTREDGRTGPRLTVASNAGPTLRTEATNRPVLRPNGPSGEATQAPPPRMPVDEFDIDHDPSPGHPQRRPEDSQIIAKPRPRNENLAKLVQMVSNLDSSEATNNPFADRPSPTGEAPPRRPAPAPEPQRVAKAPTARPAAPARQAPADQERTNPGLPSFRLAATQASNLMSSKANKATMEAHKAVRAAFTPAHPKRQAELFAGRRRQIERVISAIEEQHAHVVIMGERGLGKTSLSNIIKLLAENAGYTVLRCSCSSDLTFEEMFRDFLRQIPRQFENTPTRGEDGQPLDGPNFDALLPKGTFGATDVTNVLRYLVNKHVILVIDEFDRVQDNRLKGQLAEAIKNLSDNSALVNFLILGVAANLEELLGAHPSIQRNIVSVPLPLMQPNELKSLIAAGSKTAGIPFSNEIIDRIILLSRGLPYITQLLCLHAGQSVISRRGLAVEHGDLVNSINRILEEADRLVIDVYERTTAGGRRRLQKDILFAAAYCECDQYGGFTAEMLADAYKEISGQPTDIVTLKKALAALTKEASGPVLRKLAAPVGTKYGFQNQTMRQYIMLRQAEERGLL